MLIVPIDKDNLSMFMKEHGVKLYDGDDAAGEAPSEKELVKFKYAIFGLNVMDDHRVMAVTKKNIDELKTVLQEDGVECDGTISTWNDLYKTILTEEQDRAPKKPNPVERRRS